MRSSLTRYEVMNEYLLKETSSGKKTLIYNGSREVRLHSAYDPEKEAGRAVAGFDKGRSSLIAVSGIGLGFHITALKKKFPGVPVIAIEHDREVVEIARNEYPGHLENVVVIISSKDLGSILEKIDMAGFRGISHYVHRPSYSLYKDFYENIFIDINQYISSKISDLLTRFEFEERWIENILENIPYIFSSGSVIDLFGKFKGYPGVIVSAGPSLRKNVDLLNDISEKALVVAVDTAIKVLGKKGVSPHIIMTLDAQNYSLKHFLGMKDTSSVLLADIVCFPDVIRTYRGMKIISTTSKYYSDENGELKRETTPFMDWVEEFIDPIGDIQSGGSVATSAFDLLLNLGCDPIILVGQDLAYTGREIHCSGTYHNDDWATMLNRFLNLDTINQRVIRKRKIKYVPAFGKKGEVISDFVFDLYRGWFEDSAEKVAQKVINATEGGAMIKNTREESLSLLLERLDGRKKNPGEVLDKLISDRKDGDRENLYTAMKTVASSIAEIKSKAEKALNSGEQLDDIEELINSNDLQKIYNPFLRKARTYLSRYDSSREDAERIMLQDIISASDMLAPGNREVF